MTVGWCVYGTREMMSSAAREWEVTLREMVMVLGKEAARTWALGRMRQAGG